MERERAKKWIQPDILAMTKLLNFEEDDEDDLSDPENEGTTSQKLSVWQKNCYEGPVPLSWKSF